MVTQSAGLIFTNWHRFRHFIWDTLLTFYPTCFWHPIWHVISHVSGNCVWHLSGVLYLICSLTFILAFYLQTYLLTFLADTYPDILSNILSGILSDIFADIHSDMLSGDLTFISSHNISDNIWRFPKSWGYPQLSSIYRWIFPYIPSSYWDTPDTHIYIYQCLFNGISPICLFTGMEFQIDTPLKF